MRALKWIGGAVLVLFVLIALFFTFGLNTLRGPISKAVTKATGRELLIEGDLKPVWTWMHPRIRAEGVSFANADWGKADYLLKAEAIEATVSLLPLFIGRVVLPEVYLTRAEMSLEQDANGKKNWILKDDPEEKQQSRIFIKSLTVDDGHLAWEDATRDTSLKWKLASEGSGVAFTAEGKYQGLPLKSAGHAGHVLGLRDKSTPFPLKGDLRIGATSAKLEGTITGLIGLKGIDLKFQHLSGKSMEELYWIIGIAFPETRPYKLSGRLVRDGKLWRFEIVSGKVGESDLAGTLHVETGDFKGQKRPFMQGDLTSKVLNFGDLGALVGTNRPRKGGVLPDAPFDSRRWQSVDTDVRIRAGTIRRPEQLPLENFSTRIQMRDKVLTLNPLDFGIAGGKLTGTIRLDGTKAPIRGDVKMRVQKLQLAKLFPTIAQAQGSIGDLSGIIELIGSGDSVGKLLGSANGKIGVFMDGGQVSEYLMELMALDLWKIARVKLRGDKQIDIRCAIADFGVKDGVMVANALVFDTAVVNIGGGGTINLKNEEMDLKLKPEPKNRSIASLKSPLLVRGTFSEPDVGPDMGKLAARAAGSIAMGIINPLLAILPLMQDGSGKDSNCSQLIAQAATSSRPKAKAAASASPAPASSPQATSSSQSPASGATAPRPPSRPAR